MRKQMGFIMAAMALAGMSTQASSSSVKEGIAINPTRRPSTSVGKRLALSNGNSYKYTVTPKGNQRQLRKFLRQNAWQRKKYNMA